MAPKKGNHIEFYVIYNDVYIAFQINLFVFYVYK